MGRIEIVGLGSEGVDLEGVECLGGLETLPWSVDTVTVASSPTLPEPYCASHSSWHAYSLLIWPSKLELPMQVENGVVPHEDAFMAG